MSVPFAVDGVQLLTVCSDNGLVTAGDSLNYYVGKATIAPLASPDFIATEVGGTDCASTASTYAAYASAFYNVRRTRNIYALGCGHNSYIHGRTPAQTYADILTTVIAAKATGYAVAVWTVLDSVEIGHTWRNDLNTLIRDGAVANGYTVIDVAADTTIGCDGCYGNPTYFIDGTHPTEAGRAIQANYLRAVIRAMGVQ